LQFLHGGGLVTSTQIVWVVSVTAGLLIVALTALGFYVYRQQQRRFLQLQAMLQSENPRVATTAARLLQSGSHRESGPTRSGEPDHRWRYGLGAVLAGFVAILMAFGFALLKFDTAADAVAVAAPAIAAIGTLAGAYFGVQAGASARESNDQGPPSSAGEATEV
jgi:hypothetical protein